MTVNFFITAPDFNPQTSYLMFEQWNITFAHFC
jgi:hypothetical protein